MGIRSESQRPLEERWLSLIAAHAPGKSFLDVGCALGTLLAGIVVIVYAIVLWAFWKLLSIVAAYIALRSE